MNNNFDRFFGQNKIGLIGSNIGKKGCHACTTHTKHSQIKHTQKLQMDWYQRDLSIEWSIQPHA